MTAKNIPDSWLICHNLKEWHDWLAAHHDIETGVWLQIKKARANEHGIGLEEAVEEAICFGWIDSKMYSLDDEKYMLHMTHRKPGSMWSLINRRRAEALIADGRMTAAGMVAIGEAQANGRWEAAYTSKEKPTIPNDLATALVADQMANYHFENWSNSQKLQAVMWIEQSKKLKTRANRINKVVNCAHDNQKFI